MDVWERSAFAMSASDLDIHEAVMAVERVLEQCELAQSARSALEQAVAALQTRVR